MAPEAAATTEVLHLHARDVERRAGRNADDGPLLEVATRPHDEARSGEGEVCSRLRTHPGREQHRERGRGEPASARHVSSSLRGGGPSIQPSPSGWWYQPRAACVPPST